MIIFLIVLGVVCFAGLGFSFWSSCLRVSDEFDDRWELVAIVVAVAAFVLAFWPMIVLANREESDCHARGGHMVQDGGIVVTPKGSTIGVVVPTSSCDR